MSPKGEIDSSRVPVDGPAGLGLAVMAAVVIYAIGPLRALVAPLFLGALVIGLTLLAWRHRETRAVALGGLVLAAVALIAVVVGLVTAHA